MSKRGQFISLEGIEGVGKSTHLSGMAAVFETQGVPCLTTREPGGTPLGEQVRELLLRPSETPMGGEAELLLLFAARAEHVRQVIAPALAAGTWVLTDRFVDTSVAYQGAGRQLGVERVDVLTKWLLPDLRPDLVIVLDAEVEVAMERIRKRGQMDRFEQAGMKFFVRARQCYLERAKAEPDRYRVVNTQRPVDKVRAEIETIARSLLPS